MILAYFRRPSARRRAVAGVLASLCFVVLFDDVLIAPEWFFRLHTTMPIGTLSAAWKCARIAELVFFLCACAWPTRALAAAMSVFLSGSVVYHIIALSLGSTGRCGCVPFIEGRTGHALMAATGIIFGIAINLHDPTWRSPSPSAEQYAD